MEVQLVKFTEPVMPEQPRNALALTEVIPDRLHTPSVSLLKVLRLVQEVKHPKGMVVKLLDHVTESMPEHPQNAESPIHVQFDRSIDPVMPEHPQNA